MASSYVMIKEKHTADFPVTVLSNQHIKIIHRADHSHHVSLHHILVERDVLPARRGVLAAEVAHHPLEVLVLGGSCPHVCVSTTGRAAVVPAASPFIVL